MINVKFYKENGELKKCTIEEFYDIIKNIKNTSQKICDNWDDKDSLEVVEVFLKFEEKRIIRYTIITDLDNGIISQLYIDVLMNLQED